MNALEASEIVERFKQAYADLEAKFSNAAGQQVLVAESTANHYGCGGRNSAIETSMKLGVLTSPFERKETLRIEEIVLSTDGYAEKSGGAYASPEWELKKCAIIIPSYNF